METMSQALDSYSEYVITEVIIIFVDVCIIIRSVYKYLKQLLNIV